MKKLIALTAAFTAFAAMTTSFTTAQPAALEPDTIKIMCIGDSITDGYVPEYSGSYRKFIYRGLTGKGYSVDMVGSKDGGYTPTYTNAATGESFEYDNENTGYSGYAVKAYPGRSGILEALGQTDCLKEKQPDIVTLQIGTNNIIDNHDMSDNRADLRELVTYILANIPESSVLFVSTIPSASPNREGVRDWFGSYRHSADWQTTYDDSAVELSVQKAVSDYNAMIAELCSEMSGEHKNLFVTNAGSSINDDNKAELLFDGVHPNNEGYRLIGEHWVGTIDAYLSGKGAEETNTTTTATGDISEPVVLKVSDLVSLSRYLLGSREAADNIRLFDMDSDGVLDTYDLVRMRRAIVAQANE